MAALVALALVAAGGCGDDDPDGPPYAVASAGPVAAGAEPAVLDEEWYWIVRVDGASSTEEAIADVGAELDAGWREVDPDDVSGQSSPPSWSRASFIHVAGDGGLVWWVGTLADYTDRMPLAAPFSAEDVEAAGDEGPEVLVVQQEALD